MAEARRHGRKHITTKEIPQDVIFDNILPRLPGKSLIRCLSVSKQWKTFLRSPMFANMHLNHVINDDHQNHYKLLLIYKDTIGGFINMDCEKLDCETPGLRRPFPFKFNSEYLIWIKSSCNGLVLAVIKKRIFDDIWDLILWNPLTGDYKTLSKTVSKLDDHYVAFKLYYNSSEEDYRLLHITRLYDVHIYSLKSDSWRKINSKDAFPPNLTQAGYWKPSTCRNKNLYFTKCGSNHCSVIRFDTETEKFTEIATPHSLQSSSCSRLTVQRGCIYMCVRELDHRRNPQLRTIWSMNINGEWNIVATYIGSLLDPLHLMKDGNWLMKSLKGYDIYKVDLENKHSGHARLYNLHGCVQEKYMETFNLCHPINIRTDPKYLTS